MGRFKRWWYLSKLLTITITSFNFFNCPVNLWRNLKLKFRSKFNHDLTNHGYLHHALWKALHNFRKKEPMRQVINNFSFRMFKIMRSLTSSKCLKTTVHLTFTTQKANARSPWTACSVFNWKYLFWVNFLPRLIQICRIIWRSSLFLFLTGKTFLGKLGPKNQNCQFELKFRTRLIWICRIMLKICGVHFSYFRPEKSFSTNLVKKIKIASLSCNLVSRLIWINRIQWWCLLFLFLIMNVFFRQIWCKNSKLSVQSEIWYKD